MTRNNDLVRKKLIEITNQGLMLKAIALNVGLDVNDLSKFKGGMECLKKSDVEILSDYLNAVVIPQWKNIQPEKKIPLKVGSVTKEDEQIKNVEVNSGWEISISFPSNKTHKEKEIFKMRATTKWFDAKKGYGFVTDLDSKRDFFVHQSNIVMDRFRYLNENDIVNYELGTSKDGREQAVNVRPVLTRRMIEHSLQDENLYVKTIKDSRNVTKYLVTDENNKFQTDEKGIDFLNLAAFTGFDIEGLTA